MRRAGRLCVLGVCRLAPRWQKWGSVRVSGGLPRPATGAATLAQGRRPDRWDHSFAVLLLLYSIIGANDLEHFAHGGIITVSHAAERGVLGHVKATVHDAVITQMDADDFTKADKITLAFDLDDLGHAAL